jgi:hypothetical protein
LRQKAGSISAPKPLKERESNPHHKITKYCASDESAEHPKHGSELTRRSLLELGAFQWRNVLRTSGRAESNVLNWSTLPVAAQESVLSSHPEQELEASMSETPPALVDGRLELKASMSEKPSAFVDASDETDFTVSTSKSLGSTMALKRGLHVVLRDGAAQPPRW